MRAALRPIAILAGIGGLLIALSACQTTSSPPLPPPASFSDAFHSVSAEDQAVAMGRGLNVLGYDPYWRNISAARFQARHFTKIKAAGFQTLRLNLFGMGHLDAQGQIDAAWLSKVDWVVNQALANHLAIILDEHDMTPCAEDPVACSVKLEQLWAGLAEHFRNAPSAVLFEIMNEPNGLMDDAHWNAEMARVLSVIRRSNPDRNVIVGPASWNSRLHLDALQLPETDRHLIVTIHYYEPMTFTHQGAGWVKSTSMLHDVAWGSPSDLAKLTADFDQIQVWASDHHRPIFVGEFGAYDTVTLADRANYVRHVARIAESHHWPWAHWQFDSDFLTYDMQRDDWLHPMLDALVPPNGVR